MKDTLLSGIIKHARTDPWGFAWGVCCCIVVGFAWWAMIFVLAACADVPGVTR